ncbi:MAG TPA: SDR family oxidoreductase [Candidatus Binatia bacterium]|nr:SDR family oxidoreductase [Candidatus Binatia bacterium]
MDPRDKVAIVTGAGSGIGRASARKLCEAGAVVIAADVDEPGARETAREAVAAGGRCEAVALDVTDAARFEEVVRDVERRHGGLDILHNNAGVLAPPPLYPDAPIAVWTRMLDVNLRAVIIGTQIGISAMRRRGGGAIVNTASLAGLSGYPPDAVYAATKGGVVMLTLSLAPLAESDRIRVNCVCPGATDTGMVRGPGGAANAAFSAFIPPDMPLLSPDDVAEGVLTLVRDDSLAGRALKVMVKGPSLEPLPKGAWRPGTS